MWNTRAFWTSCLIVVGAVYASTSKSTTHGVPVGTGGESGEDGGSGSGAETQASGGEAASSATGGAGATGGSGSILDCEAEGVPSEDCECGNGETRDCSECGAQECVGGQWGLCSGEPDLCGDDGCGQLTCQEDGTWSECESNGAEPRPCGSAGCAAQECTSDGTWGSCEGDDPTVCTACAPSAFPFVIECGSGFMDAEEHAVGESYANTADDLRLATSSTPCGPADACTADGTHPDGLDLQFKLGLGPGPVGSAQITLKGYPNSPEPATVVFSDRCTGEQIGSCNLSGSMGWQECTATLDASYVDGEDAFINLTVATNACYFVIDVLHLDATN